MDRGAFFEEGDIANWFKRSDFSKTSSISRSIHVDIMLGTLFGVYTGKIRIRCVYDVDVLGENGDETGSFSMCLNPGCRRVQIGQHLNSVI